jgi:hypothetical protein
MPERRAGQTTLALDLGLDGDNVGLLQRRRLRLGDRRACGLIDQQRRKVPVRQRLHLS